MVPMNASYSEKEVRTWVMGFGLILIFIGIALIASWTQNVFFIPLGFFVFMLGAGAVATGFATAWWDRPPVPKIRCRQCYTLNYETAMRCRKCGNSMF
jgi:hypothetical protein